MFEIRSQNSFLEKSLISLFEQKKIPLVFSKYNHHKNIIQFSLCGNKTLKIDFNEYSEKIEIPTSFESLFYKSFKILSNYYIKVGPLILNPIKQSLSTEKKQIELRYTHTLILSYFFLNKQDGISKQKLYSKIWPKDFELNISKLDTHLTNLKNLIFEYLECELNFKSENGVLTFNIN